jgi:tetratricopeptide (TPR) repeat protein
MVLQAHRLEKDAALCYRRASQLAPGEFRWRYLLAHALRDSDAASALAEAETAARLKPDYSPTYVFRAQLLEAANQRELALDQYQKGAMLDKESALAEFGLGRLYLAKGDQERALAHLVRARDLSEEAPAIRGALAQVYRRLGDQESALRENRLASELHEAIAINDPVHYAMRKESVASTALLERAIDADRVGDYETAESLFRELVELRPDDANIRARFADTLARQSKLQPAREQYEAALAIHPNLASAHYGLGNMLNFARDYEAAERHYRQAMELRPDHVSTLVNLGSLLAFKGRVAEAASLFRKAVEVQPQAFAPNRQLGEALLRQNKPAEAIPYLRAAVEVRPDAGAVHLGLGMALAATGDFQGAWEHVSKAQQLGENVRPPLLEELRRRASAR